MPDIETEVLEYVRQNPGCKGGDLIRNVQWQSETETPDYNAQCNAADEANCMVSKGKLDRWYTGTVPAYYIPGTYTPPHLIADTEDAQEGAIPLAAGLHRDETIHIYVKEKDSGLSVGLLEDGTLIVKVDESMRTMVAGKAR